MLLSCAMAMSIFFTADSFMIKKGNLSIYSHYTVNRNFFRHSHKRADVLNLTECKIGSRSTLTDKRPKQIALFPCVRCVAGCSHSVNVATLKGKDNIFRRSLLSRSDLSSFFMSLFSVGQGVSWGG